MQTLTFTQKLLRQRRFLSSLIPLLALFLGLGEQVQAQTAAQTAITSSTAVLSRNGAANTVYNANPNTPNPLEGADLGSYDINTGQLVLNGGTVNTSESGTSRINEVKLNYKIYDPTFNTTLASGFTILPTIGGTNGGPRTFENLAAGIDLVGLVRASGGTAATGYNLEVSYSSTYRVNGTGPNRPGATDGPYYATFDITGIVTPPTNISNTTVILDTTQVSAGSPANPNINENMTYNLNPSTPTPFNGATLGGTPGYEINTGRLFLNGGSTNTFASGGDIVRSVTLFYRIYKAGATPPPTYKAVSLAPGTLNAGSRTFSLNNAQVSLITTDVTNAGTGVFRIQAYTQADIERSDMTFYSLRDDNNGLTSYVASFNTKGVPLVSTTWISTSSSEWLLPANWSNGVPNRFTNAVIPAKDETNPTTSTPILDNPNATYEVQNLTIRGDLNSNRGLVRVGPSTVTNGPIVGASLRIYGDLINTAGGLLAGNSGTNGSADPAKNSTVIFAGDASNTAIINGTVQSTGGNQKIFGATLVQDVRIEGTGVKAVFNTLATPNTLTFAPGITALIRTVLPDGTLNTTKTSLVDLKESGTIFGETNIAFIEGSTQADRALVAGVKQTFGNIGVDITPNRSIPLPATVVTRTVGDPFKGPVGSGAQGVKRQYGVTGDVNNNTISDLAFHYLDSAAPAPYDELNGNVEDNLIIFKTSNNGIPFQALGGTVNKSASFYTRTVSLSGVGSINTITLADRLRPLPVTVSAFDAKRLGTDALVTWTTAQEQNNKGFNVQVSSDAKSYRNIGFVASQMPNSTSAQNYSFTDTEKNKTGVRYYRLQQMDVDGKTAFFAPRAITFEGRATESSLTVYPNPYTADLRVSLSSAMSGNATARITDMTGRVISQQTLSLTVGSNDLPIENMNGLKTGLYLLHVTLPSGENKTLKVVKQ